MIRFWKAFMYACLLVMPIVIASAIESHATTANVFYVSKGGNDSYNCLSPTTACSTINGGLAKAGSGDTLLVTAETYTGIGDQVIYIDKDISISGGWNQTFTNRIGYSIADGQNARRVIYIAEMTNVSIEYFILQNGFNNDGGAGIWNYGTLLIDNCIVQNNLGADFGGGGISNAGNLTVQWCTIRNNSGTAIYNWDFAGPLTILNSAINNNTHGPGIRIYNQDASIINSTISGNTNTSYYNDGGGIYYGGGTDKTLLLRNVTITGNKATERGGGIYMFNGYGGQVLISNSIISGNNAYWSPDCSGPITSQGYNIIGDTFDCSFSSTTGDQLDVDPLIGLLQDNGGPTYTHWIYANSPAIDSGNPEGCLDQLGNPLTIDQRGFTRPLDANGDGNNICDIGAYEADPDNLPPISPNSIRYVSPSGNNANDCLSPSKACKTIKGAIDRASSGDYVYVSTGVFSEPSENEVILINKSINIYGGWNPEFTQQIGYSFIDGKNSRRGITINHDLTVRLERVFVQNGLSLENDGGGIYVGYSTRLTVTDSVISANKSGNTDPIHPSYTNGGGIGMGTFGRLTLSNSLIIGNSAVSSGGGIYSSESTVILNNSIVSNNTAGLGGGIASKVSGQIELNYSEVVNNSSVNWGGGVDSSDTYLILKNSTVRGNTAGGPGGGLFGHSMIIENSSIDGNTASSGGGIYTQSNIEIRNSAILNNTASYGDGGGIHSSQELILVNTTIANNRAENPYTDEADGGGIFRAGGWILQASNVSIVRNIAERFGGGIWSNDAQITFRNTLLADNQAAIGPDCTGTIHSNGYNLIGDTSGCNFVPMLGDQTDVDSRLAFPFGNPGTLALWADSPAIDGGNPVGCLDQLGDPITTDQIGTLRPLDGDEDGEFVCDIGAFEYNPASPPRWFFLPEINKK